MATRKTLTRDEQEFAHSLLHDIQGDFDWDIACFLNEYPDDRKVIEHAVSKFAAYVKPALKRAIRIERESLRRIAAEGSES